MAEISNALSIIDSIDNNVVARTMKKIQDFQIIIQGALKPSHDYGIIPGCDKPSLLKPGAEKINMMMGVTSEYDIMDKVEDYDKGFFAYNVKCVLSKNGAKITEGVGNCNSREKKYVSQDPYSITNTILKMAKKRAYIDASLTVASLSDIFTQDVDDPDLRITSSSATHQANQGKSAGEIVITFGKNKGRTLAELYENDRGYFDWLLKNNDKFKPHCEEYLKSQQAGPSTLTDGVPPCTKEQRRAIQALAATKEVNIQELLNKCGVDNLDSVTVNQAAKLIELLQNHNPKEQPMDSDYLGEKIPF